MNEKHNEDQKTFEERLAIHLYTNLCKESYRIKYSALSRRKGEDSLISERIITPYLVFSRVDGSQRWWGVQAFCELRQDMRWFYLHRMQLVDPMPLVRAVRFQDVLHLGATLAMRHPWIYESMDLLHREFLKASGYPEEIRR